jgi:transcriptional regulator with XRE-family HTH domain
MPRPPKDKGLTFGSYVRQRRLARGLSVADLAEQLGMSRSYLSLIENGDRAASEALAKEAARALGDPPGRYMDLVRLESRGGVADLDSTTLEPLARVELWPEGEGPGRLNLEVKLAKPSAVAEQRGRLPQTASRVPPVPIVEEGTRLESLPRGAEVEFLTIDPAVVSDRETLVRPFAWRLSETGAAHAPDILEPGDTVVITQEPGDIADDEIYAVRDRDDVIVLSRIQIKGDVLLLMGPDGTVRDALPARKGSPLSRVAGKLVIVIRPWRYAVLRPHAKK